MPHPPTLRSVLMSVVKEQQRKDFRTWDGSPNFFRQEAALVDYKAETIHLTSSEGASLGIPKSKSSKGNIRLPDVRGKAHYQVITLPVIPRSSLRLPDIAGPPRVVSYFPRLRFSTRTFMVACAGHHFAVF